MKVAPACSTRRRMLAASLLASATAGCATRAPAASGIERRVLGTGHPLVVFQSGLGDGMSVWSAVQSALPGTIASVAFSRPGYGRSAWAEGGRSPCAVARLTRDFLRRAGLEPPYLLVGHSLGGLYQYAFARLFSNEVAGLVLLDPTHPQQWGALQREAPALAAVVKAARATSFSTAMRREFDDQSLCGDELEALRTHAPAPAPAVRLLLRDRFVGLEAGAFERLAHRLEADWARRLGGAEPIRVPGSGHHLQRDRPHAVSDAIVALVAAARSG
ncbi:MAG: alpha/beta hydrolase [Burkholderiales bacterium]|nr:alpha/beta hydrolase [Burkholderiales bacterium]